MLESSWHIFSTMWWPLSLNPSRATLELHWNAFTITRHGLLCSALHYVCSKVIFRFTIRSSWTRSSSRPSSALHCLGAHSTTRCATPGYVRLDVWIEVNRSLTRENLLRHAPWGRSSSYPFHPLLDTSSTS